MPLCSPVKSDPLACILFTYRGNIVAIDLVGAGIPLALSLAFIAIIFVRSGKRVRAYRAAVYTALAIVLGAVAAGEYVLWDFLYGGLSINTRLLLYTVLIPVGIAEFLLLDRARRPKLSLLQTYVVGTVGTTLSDLFRTFSGTLNVSPQIIGAAGLQDGIFLDGLLLILGYLAGAVLYVSIIRWKEKRAEGTSNGSVENPHVASAKDEGHTETEHVSTSSPSTRISRNRKVDFSSSTNLEVDGIVMHYSYEFAVIFSTVSTLIRFPFVGYCM